MKRRIDDELRGRIEAVCIMLQNSVTFIQVLNWLRNFKDREWEIALSILENLKYFTNDQIVYEFDSGLKRMIDSNSDDTKFFIIGIGDYGKSGTTLIYFLKKTPTFIKNQDRFKILKHVEKLNSQGVKDGAQLVLLDDIIGSGKSLATYYRTNIKNQILKDHLDIELSVLSVVYMRDSFTYLKGLIPGIKIYGTEYIKAFNSGSSCFGYRPKMLPIRNFCYQYGKALHVTYDFGSKRYIQHPLGYNNSQSLVVFSHSTPNNTLPIIWSSKNGWFPLFPRSAREKVSRFKDFRSDNLYWVNVGYKLNFFKNKPQDSDIFFKDINYKVLGLIRLIKRGSIPPIICQQLNLSISELSEVLSTAVDNGLLNIDHSISRKGEHIYTEIRKKIKISEKSNVKKHRPEILYVPKTFLGKT